MTRSCLEAAGARLLSEHQAEWRGRQIDVRRLPAGVALAAPAPRGRVDGPVEALRCNARRSAGVAYLALVGDGLVLRRVLDAGALMTPGRLAAALAALCDAGAEPLSELGAPPGLVCRPLFELRPARTLDGETARALAVLLLLRDGVSRTPGRHHRLDGPSLWDTALAQPEGSGPSSAAALRTVAEREARLLEAVVESPPAIAHLMARWPTQDDPAP